MLLHLALASQLLSASFAYAREGQGPRALEVTSCHFQHTPHVRGRSSEFLREGLLSAVKEKGGVRITLFERPTLKRAGVARINFKLKELRGRRLNRQYLVWGDRALREKASFVAAGTPDTWISYVVNNAQAQLGPERLTLVHEMTLLESGVQVRELVECQLADDVTARDLRHFADR